MQDNDPYTLFGVTFGISSIAGLAALLRSKQELTQRLVISAFLNAGLFGTGVAMVWYECYGGKAHPWFVMGISLLAGLGGTTLLDFCLQGAGVLIQNYSQRLGNALPVGGQATTPTTGPASLPVSNEPQPPEPKP